MRTLILAGLVVAGLVAAGVIHIQKGSDTINITVDKEKFHETTEKAVQMSDQVLHEAERRLDEASKTQTK
ncbi:MAG TPA: hypothetical protein VHY20_02180 [Pirellulales bacterium]|jgi:hypothetical protein|nr:hypothetical protein [Pirellulales bacterium]